MIDFVVSLKPSSEPVFKSAICYFNEPTKSTSRESMLKIKNILLKIRSSFPISCSVCWYGGRRWWGICGAARIVSGQTHSGTALFSRCFIDFKHTTFHLHVMVWGHLVLNWHECTIFLYQVCLFSHYLSITLKVIHYLGVPCYFNNSKSGFLFFK